MGYGECGSVYEVARRFGTTRANVAAILEGQGVQRRYNVLSEADVSGAAELYAGGLSLARLGERFGVAARTIHAALRRRGVPLRPVGTNQWVS